jgi:hypothetical protein
VPRGGAVCIHVCLSRPGRRLAVRSRVNFCSAVSAPQRSSPSTPPDPLTYYLFHWLRPARPGPHMACGRLAGHRRRLRLRLASTHPHPPSPPPPPPPPPHPPPPQVDERLALSAKPLCSWHAHPLGGRLARALAAKYLAAHDPQVDAWRRQDIANYTEGEAGHEGGEGKRAASSPLSCPLLFEQMAGLLAVVFDNCDVRYASNCISGQEPRLCYIGSRQRTPVALRTTAHEILKLAQSDTPQATLSDLESGAGTWARPSPPVRAMCGVWGVLWNCGQSPDCMRTNQRASE